MKIYYLLPLVMLFALSVTGQTVDSIFYSNPTYHKQVPRSNYLRIITTQGEYVEDLFKNVKKDRLISYKALKGDEPVGVWKTLTTGGLQETNYDFSVNYSNKSCESWRDYDCKRTLLLDIPRENYKSPILLYKGEKKDFRKMFFRAFRTPKSVRVKSQKGGYVIEVDFNFNVNQKGEIEDVFIVKGDSIEVDKEVVRALKSLHFDHPPKVNGKPHQMNFFYNLKMQVVPNAL